MWIEHTRAALTYCLEKVMNFYATLESTKNLFIYPVNLSY